MKLLVTPFLYCGDCLDVAAELEADSIDYIVSDPPYGLGFMGKDWDHGVPGVHFWNAFYRIVKPGAHLLAFGGTRTFHRQVVAIEDSGWEIRDMLGWLYGSGFPKSLDVSKSIDKAYGAEREVVGQWKPTVNARKSNIPGHGAAVSNSTENRIFKNDFIPITAPSTDAAKQWQGWGTALKPAWEPICLARKPLVGTVAGNVLRYGTGAINVGGCRIGDEVRFNESAGNKNLQIKVTVAPISKQTENSGRECTGRWPANIIHDDSDEVVALFPADDGASAARFFYTAKASRDDRDEGLDGELKPSGGMSGRNDGSMGSITMRRNIHPTVKPTDLMRYLVRLITPAGAIVFDPFMGSGSTGKAAMLEGRRFVGAELSPDYFDIACRRIEHAYKEARRQPMLFEPEPVQKPKENQKELF